jgi:hypothetical protein
MYVGQIHRIYRYVYSLYIVYICNRYIVYIGLSRGGWLV